MGRSRTCYSELQRGAGQSIYLVFLWELSLCDCKMGTSGLTCCPGELTGVTNSSLGRVGACQSPVPFVLPLEQTPRA